MGLCNLPMHRAESLATGSDTLYSIYFGRSITHLILGPARDSIHPRNTQRSLVPFITVITSLHLRTVVFIITRRGFHFRATGPHYAVGQHPLQEEGYGNCYAQ